MQALKVGEYETLLDEADYERVKDQRWHITTSKYKAGRTYVYVGRSDYKAKRMIMLHRVIMDAPPGLVVDHINGNTLDNTRANLRLLTNEENLRHHVAIKLTRQRKHIRLTAEKKFALAISADSYDAPLSYDKKRGPMKELSPREREVLDLLSQGNVLSEIAKLLGLAPNTVATHLQRMKKKLGARNSVHAAVIWARIQWTASDEYDSWSK